MSVAVTFARMCRDQRRRLRLTQDELGQRVGVIRGHIANVELGRSNPSLELMGRIAMALDLEIDLVARPPTVVGVERQRDLVHARCWGYADRRFRRAGWLTAREVEIVQGRWHGWIDLLAFDPGSGTLIVVEIKTQIADIGALERQVGWYERSAFRVARGRGWQPRRTVVWVLALASLEVEATLRSNREVLAGAFPTRARQMRRLVERVDRQVIGRGLALIDPTIRRSAWLLPSRLEGRRSPPSYLGYADAARRLGGEASPRS
jgi:transcriptional regulator with XRE-family HTH domain